MANENNQEAAVAVVSSTAVFHTTEATAADHHSSPTVTEATPDEHSHAVADATATEHSHTTAVATPSTACCSHTTMAEAPLAEEDLGRPRAEAFSEEDFCCPICLDLLLRPVVLACGHRLCRGCWCRVLQGREMRATANLTGSASCPLGRCERLWSKGKRRLSDACHSSPTHILRDVGCSVLCSPGAPRALDRGPQATVALRGGTPPVASNEVLSRSPFHSFVLFHPKAR